MRKKERAAVITLALVILLCIAGPVAVSVLRAAPPTEADLVGRWIADNTTITLREDGTAVLEGVPDSDGGVLSGGASWRLWDNSSEGWQVSVASAEGDLRLYVDQQWLATYLVQYVCDPDQPECVVSFERSVLP